MAQTLDILDERDPIAAPFLGAILIHLSIVGVVFLYWYWLGRPAEIIGDANAGGSAYSVGITKSIPIPQREAPPNPVANDSQSTVRTAPAKQETEKPPIPDKTAVEIPDKAKPKKPDEKPRNQQKYMTPAPQNQIYSQSRQAVSNPMYGGPAGSGQVGVGPNTPLGDNRLGWYAELIRQRLTQNWQSGGLGGGAPVIVSFTIMRDGSIRDPKVFQSSGNPTIDNTALRAVYSSNPLPPLPPQVTGSTLPAQYTFQIR
jgi:TonB family protein